MSMTLYQDPDIMVAENMTLAAHYLAECGQASQSENLVNQIAEAFRDAPLDKKSTQPCKILGKARYYAAGMITMPEKSIGTVQVAAPAWDPADDTNGIAERAAKKRAASMCRSAHLSWFQEKQVAAAMGGTRINAGTFKPAKTLKTVKRLLEASRKEMPPQARAVLGQRLMKAIGGIPATRRKETGLERSLVEEGGSYFWDRRPIRVGFSWFSEDTLKTAVDILERGMHDASYELQKLPDHTVYWTQMPPDIVNALLEPLQYQDSPYAETIPFLTMHWGERRKCETEGWVSYQEYVQQPIMKVHHMLEEVMELTVDLRELLSAHRGLQKIDDEYAVGQLTAAGILDTELELRDQDVIDAAVLCAASAYAIKGADERMAEAAVDACRTILEKCGSSLKWIPHTTAKEYDDEEAC